MASALGIWIAQQQAAERRHLPNDILRSVDAGAPRLFYTRPITQRSRIGLRRLRRSAAPRHDPVMRIDAVLLLTLFQRLAGHSVPGLAEWISRLLKKYEFQCLAGHSVPGLRLEGSSHRATRGFEPS